MGVQPELKERVVLLQEIRRGSVQVAACSATAYKRGIFPGMPLSEAVALAGADLQLLHFDPATDRRGLEDLAAECEAFSPLVGIEEAEYPESLFLDVTGLGEIFGSEEILAEQLRRTMERRGLRVRIAIAPTYGAAWAIAHFAAPQPRVIAKSELRGALVDLPVSALRISAETKRLLTELSLLQIRQLLLLPRTSFASRFGPELLRRLDQALGLAEEQITFYRATPELVEEWRFEEPSEERRELELVMGELCERIARLLAQRQQGAVQLQCTFFIQQLPPVLLRVGLYQATAVADHLRELLLTRLERTVITGPVTTMQLAVLLSAPLQFRQQELFSAGGQNDCRQVALLIERLSSRLERTAVVRPKLVPDAQPEFAYCYEPLTGNRPRKPGQSPPAKKLTPKKNAPPPRAPAAFPLTRPLWLEPRPKPIEVIWTPPYGRPRQVRIQHELHRVERSWGPERIATGWWRGPAIHRDYFRIETTTGERYWIFRCLEERRWYLQGVFD